MTDPLDRLAEIIPDVVDAEVTLVIRSNGLGNYVHWRFQRPDLSYEDGTELSFGEALSELKEWLTDKDWLDGPAEETPTDG